MTKSPGRSDSGLKCANRCGRSVWNYPTSLKRFDPKLVFCAPCRAKRARERKEAERRDVVR